MAKTLMSSKDRGQTSGRLLGLVAALVSAVFFGLNAVASKVLYSPESPSGFDAVGLFVARGLWTLPLFIILAIATKPKKLPYLTLKDASLFLLCGLTYGPGTNAMSALGASATSASHAVLLLSLFPALAATLAVIFLKERLAPIRMVAILIGIVGAAVLTLSSTTSGATPIGDLMILGFIFAWALLTIGIRQLDRSYPALFVAGIFGTLGSILLALIGWWLNRLYAGLVPLHHFDPQTIVWFDLELVLFLSLGGQLLQSVALRVLNVGTVVALTSYGSIFFGLASSLIILRERLSVQDVIAGALLLMALALSLVPVDFMHRLLSMRAFRSARARGP